MGISACIHQNAGQRSWTIPETMLHGLVKISGWLTALPRLGASAFRSAKSNFPAWRATHDVEKSSRPGKGINDMKTNFRLALSFVTMSWTIRLYIAVSLMVQSEAVQTDGQHMGRQTNCGKHGHQEMVDLYACSAADGDKITCLTRGCPYSDKELTRWYLKKRVELRCEHFKRKTYQCYHCQAYIMVYPPGFGPTSRGNFAAKANSPAS